MTPETTRSESLSAPHLAANLIYQDRYLLLCLFPLLAAPALLSQSAALANIFSLKVASRLVDLAFFWLIGIRTLKTAAPLSRAHKRFFPMLVFFLIGFGVWIAELTVAQGLVQPAFRVLALPAGVALFCISYVFFFFFMPLLTGAPLSGQAMTQITKIDRWAPIKASVAPFAIMFLATALLELPYPDGREARLSYLSAGVTPIYWCLSTYLSLAFGLILLPEGQWRQAGLDPYKAERLQTMGLKPPEFLAKALMPGTGAKVMVLAILLNVANASRLISLPPSPEITLKQVTAFADVIRVELVAKDEKYQFRNFQPLFFNISGENGKSVVSRPEKATLEGSNEDVKIIFPSTTGPITLNLFFIPEKPIDEIKQLEDLYLWYRGHRMMHLDLKTPK